MTKDQSGFVTIYGTPSDAIFWAFEGGLETIELCPLSYECDLCEIRMS
jgi:hypothetical protein